MMATRKTILFSGKIDRQLRHDLEDVLAALDRELIEICGQSEEPVIAKQAVRIVDAGGKRLRPALAWLSWRAVSAGNKTGEPLPLMCMLELMHTASLIHDDVVDRAPERRGEPTVNAVEGAAAAVRCGDFMLAKAMEKLKIYRGTGINEALAKVSGEMCRGELWQQRRLFSLAQQNECFYYAQIQCKTSSLLAASCYTGALAGKAEPELAACLRHYGDRLGMAFQIRDDILDFTVPEKFGKRRGQDVASGIYTLPVLMLKPVLSERMRQLLERRSKSPEEIKEIVQYVTDSGALESAERVVMGLSEQAVAALNALSDGPEKEALTMLAAALTKREQ